MRFRDRRHAGALLVEALKPLGLERPVVLGIPRGGVVVADEVAKGLGGELDVVLVRKVGAPGNPEFALGAVGEKGGMVLKPYALQYADQSYLEREAARQKDVIRKRAERYRKVRPKVPLAGRDVVLVDDGIATGSTMEAALAVVLSEKPRRVVVAVPVASPDAVEGLKDQAEVVVLSTPPDFAAVGAYFMDFGEVTDEEVEGLLLQWSA
ncbi:MULTISPECIES: phosphoribosyltransferase family protein [Thermus]|uniref:Phosphoribosyl transferase n=2 Tax=Thermus scotoductus TaxID=37636 RepID=A0A0N0IQ36_THESC|nr:MULTISPECIES: phosphoribosyltransferase family protein [Thermus]ADW22519.1 phosphoribosyl transferase domain protein [Thermus scotoductus SA-01]KPD27713.1 phosphoribosyl transferase [Thermus scotoductus]HAR69530.1 phosphoribosyl transferase [Thermus scotoductus]